MGDQHILVCQPAAAADPATMVPDAKMRVCQACNAAIYMAPSGREFVEENPDCRVLCLDCGMSSMVANQVTGVQRVESATSDAELGEYKDEVDEVLQTIRKRLGLPD